MKLFPASTKLKGGFGRRSVEQGDKRGRLPLLLPLLSPVPTIGSTGVKGHGGDEAGSVVEEVRAAIRSVGSRRWGG